MQWVADHWFELATIARLAAIATVMLERRWNNATIVGQLNDITYGSPGITPSPVVTRVQPLREEQFKSRSTLLGELGQ